MSNTPAGWYDDGSGRQRWWNGSEWTDAFADQQTVESPQPANTVAGFLKSPKGLGIVALVAGVVAFLLGLVPVLGIILGLGGVGLGAYALFKRQPKGLALTGLILAGLAIFASIGTTLGLPAPGDKVEYSASYTPLGEDPEETSSPTVTPDETEPAPTAEAPVPAEEPEKVAPAGPTDAEKSAAFDRALKDSMGVSDSFQEVFVNDPTLWAGYIVGARVEGSNAYVTLQVDRSTPEGKELGERAARAISTLMTQETVDTLDLSWIIVEDGTGTIIDQHMFNPLL